MSQGRAKEGIATYLSPLGPMLLKCEGQRLSGLWFKDAKYAPPWPGETSQTGRLPVFEQTMKWLDWYFAGENPVDMPPLAMRGSDFRLAVWAVLQSIPYGQLRTYGEIAKELEQKLGRPMSAQAVGGAVGHNPLSILVPCHRVVGADGNLTGYAGGLDKKIALLKLEKADLRSLYAPSSGTVL